MSNRIASLRKAAGLTQRQLAERMGVQPETISRWERGVMKMTDENKLALSTLFGCTVGFLMGWDQPNGDENGNGERESA